MDTEGDTVFLLTKKRDKKAAIRLNGMPEKVTIDKSGANTAALEGLNQEQKVSGKPEIQIRQIKYLNNRRITGVSNGKRFKMVRRALKGVELCHMIHKGQYDKTQSANDWEYFYSLAA